MKVNSQDIVLALAAAGIIHGAARKLHFSTLKGDGSDRVFVRVELGAARSVLVILPSPTLPEAMAEARACFAIGRHLFLQGVAVPAIHGFEARSGAVVCEDLGDVSLFAIVHDHGNKQRAELYDQAVRALAKLQILGRHDFDGSWCWDTQHYDRKLMLERESGYFAEQFCASYLQEPVPETVKVEFLRLAERVSREPAHFLLHRDFQSRNLMVKDGVVRIIDFQGARYGPLAYDLASLLNDPYVRISAPEKRRLVAVYLTAAAALVDFDQDAFLAGYAHVALQRKLQVLGAYAFLSQQRGKLFFAQYIAPALETLAELLAVPLQDTYPQLKAFALKLRTKFQARQNR